MRGESASRRSMSTMSQSQGSRASFARSWATSQTFRESVLVSQEQSDPVRRRSSFLQPDNAPSVWPAVFVSFLHNVSMGAALMVWIDVCAEVFKDETHSEAGSSGNMVTDPNAQSLYGRLLATNAICELLTSQLVGVLSDRYGRRPLQISAQIGQIIDYAAAGICLPSLGLIGAVPKDYIVPMLFVTRGIAGIMGNNGLTLQSYTSDISSAADCPDRLAYLGAAMVIGMCVGSVMVSVTDVMQASFRVCYWVAVTMNMGIVLVVALVWRDVAPRKSFRVAEAHPAAGIWILKSCRAMTLYALLIFLASFSVNMYSSLAYYCHNILMMPINMVVLLGVLWALTAAFCLAVVQPFLAGKYGEINTLKIAFMSITLFFLLFSCITERTWWMSFAIIGLFSLGSMASPMAVGLAAREVNAEDQGSLMGAVSILETTGKIVAPLLASDILIPMFAGPGQFHGIVYFVAALIVMPGIAVAARLSAVTTRVSAAGRPTMVEMQ